jgi:hypothetical protein
MTLSEHVKAEGTDIAYEFSKSFKMPTQQEILKGQYGTHLVFKSLCDKFVGNRTLTKHIFKIEPVSKVWLLVKVREEQEDITGEVLMSSDKLSKLHGVVMSSLIDDGIMVLVGATQEEPVTAKKTYYNTDGRPYFHLDDLKAAEEFDNNNKDDEQDYFKADGY